jgi:3-dehydroquinate synthetase
MMTIPVKTSNPVKADPATVGVALGDRAYDIVIGRDVLPSLGHRIARLRPGARVAIVTDRTVAKHWLAQAEAALADAGISSSRIVVGEGESSKVMPSCRTCPKV